VTFRRQRGLRLHRALALQARGQAVVRQTAVTEKVHQDRGCSRETGQRNAGFFAVAALASFVSSGDHANKTTAPSVVSKSHERWWNDLPVILQFTGGRPRGEYVVKCLAPERQSGRLAR
jgi:hypothetical protein